MNMYNPREKRIVAETENFRVEADGEANMYTILLHDTEWIAAIRMNGKLRYDQQVELLRRWISVLEGDEKISE